MKNIHTTALCFLLITAAGCGTIGTDRNTSKKPPLVCVYAEGHLPVENVTVSVTNPNSDMGILVTSVEFPGQLPELRYFYHGIYGRISKSGETYEHFAMAQQLSRPVSSCFLLPGQSVSWQRPLRLLPAGYQVDISWKEVPKEQIAKSIWFESKLSDNGLMVYERLAKDKEAVYSDLTTTKSATPYVIPEGNFQERKATTQAKCLGKRGNTTPSPRTIAGFPPNSIELSLPPVAEDIVISGDKVTFRKYDRSKKAYTIAGPCSLKPTVIDLLYQCGTTKEGLVPCLLPKEHCADIIEVKTPSTRMYRDPGITQVPMKLFPQILTRAKERGLSVEVQRIDPNGLRRRNVVAIRDTPPTN